ncbi:hypothetical protein COU88_01005 [Candidatus Roizmanbacteria bacterium CG10_big_fil_rev_8_21_14_0_10_39_6]|uniref:Uncharacterized protein n=1 Tax=Candidatus Roizmanbacteria bacterium CG10_big_fil_rev_8_21_14_0_10_39_6 TaxID=1974853 RepID=A0A2M8KTG0_9BACT|nr:MAG: hypothetical protein COU88_01005 [Candidatus Roizmanbacteria bacterium CG10_big_fil_rev_8_21_14_0_10_39_6]
MSDSEKNLIDLVVSRLQVLSDDQEISVGSEGEYTKSQLIQHVKKSDALGKKFVEIELQYLQSLKDITQSVLIGE